MSVFYVGFLNFFDKLTTLGNPELKSGLSTGLYKLSSTGQLICHLTHALHRSHSTQMLQAVSETQRFPTAYGS